MEVIDKKTLRNKMIKSKVKTVIKKVEAAIAAGDKEAAQANLLVAISEINKAASRAFTTRTMLLVKYHVLQPLSTRWLNLTHIYFYN